MQNFSFWKIPYTSTLSQYVGDVMDTFSLTEACFKMDPSTLHKKPLLRKVFKI